MLVVQEPSIERLLRARGRATWDV